MKKELTNIITLLQNGVDSNSMETVQSGINELKAYLNEYCARRSLSGSRITDKKTASSRKNFESARLSKSYINSAEDPEEARQKLKERQQVLNSLQGLLFDFEELKKHAAALPESADDLQQNELFNDQETQPNEN